MVGRVRTSDEDGNRSFYGALGPEGLADLVEAAKTKADLVWLRPFVRGRLRVLDLACGYGRIAVPLARRRTLAVSGVDLDPALIAAARRAARVAGVPARFRVGDMTAPPYPPGSFDRVLCLWSSFQHLTTVAAQQRCVRAVHRLLAPGGKALIEVVDGGDAATQRRLRQQGQGRDRRVATWTIGAAAIRVYIHHRASLAAACAAWPGSWRIEAVRIHGHARLVALLDHGVGTAASGTAAGGGTGGDSTAP